MDLSPVIPTVVGGVLALGGGFLGQLWGERRAVAREQRDREHEREVWARGLRYESHVEFLNILDAKYRVIQEAKDDPRAPEAPDDFLVPVWDRYQALRIVCTEDTAAEAEEVIVALHQYAYKDGQWEVVEYRRDFYLGAIRKEFHLPPIPLMGD